jgi:hypothetical protein
MAVYHPCWTVNPFTQQRRVFVDMDRNKKWSIITSYTNCKRQCGASLLWDGSASLDVRSEHRLLVKAAWNRNPVVVMT